jgi:hypothetical protein
LAHSGVEQRSDVDLIVLVATGAAPHGFLLAHAVGALLTGAGAVDATPADTGASNLSSAEYANHLL